MADIHIRLAWGGTDVRRSLEIGVPGEIAVLGVENDETRAG
jgi:hypothetical protein